MDVSGILIICNLILGALIFLLKRAIDAYDKKFVEISDRLDKLLEMFQEHKDDDHKMALDIATLEANRAEHVRSLERIEIAIEELRKAI